MNDQAMQNVLRAQAEQEYAEELAELRRVDNRQRPPNWVLSPWAVRTYLLGGKLPNGFEISPKYIGNARLIEIAVATLATDRALLLYGIPGTAKSWVSEHLAAAIAGDSTLLVQGTAGTDENRAALRLELCPPAGRGPIPRRAGGQPDAARDGNRQDGAHRGADAHPGRGAGYADHDPFGKDAAGARAEHTRYRRARAST